MKLLKLVFPLIMITIVFQRCQGNDMVDIYTIDSENSIINWQGHTTAYTNTGTLKFLANDIKAEKGRIKSGTITIPLSTITNNNQPEELQPVVIDQLKSGAFFNFFLYPTIEFKIREVELLSGIHPSAVSGANWWVRGDMTMLGQTHQVSFPAKIKFYGNDMEVEAKFSIDRTKWGMHFGNDPTLGEHQILPIVDLHLSGKASIKNKVVI